MFQESIPPSSREESQDRACRGGTRETSVTMRENDTSRERLTERATQGSQEKTSIDLAASVADCCCIGPRSRLPLPKIPLTPNVSAGVEVVGDVGDCGGGGGGKLVQSPPLAVRNESARLPPNSNANNNRGGLQMGSQQPQQHGCSQPRSAAASISNSSVTCGAGAASSFAPVAHTVSSVPRQIAQWTKHQTLKLQVRSSLPEN